MLLPLTMVIKTTKNNKLCERTMVNAGWPNYNLFSDIWTLEILKIAPVGKERVLYLITLAAHIHERYGIFLGRY